MTLEELKQLMKRYQELDHKLYSYPSNPAELEENEETLIEQGEIKEQFEGTGLIIDMDEFGTVAVWLGDKEGR